MITALFDAWQRVRRWLEQAISGGASTRWTGPDDSHPRTPD